MKYRHLAPSTGTLQLIAGASLLAWAARRWLSRRAQAAAVAVVLGGLWIGFTVTGWAPQTNLAARVDAHLIGVAVGSRAARHRERVDHRGRRRLGRRRRPARRPTPMAAGRSWPARAGLATTGGRASRWRWPSRSTSASGRRPTSCSAPGLSCLVLAALLWWCGRRLGDDGLGPLQTLGANAIAVYVATSLAATTVLAPVQEPVVDCPGRR